MRFRSTLITGATMVASAALVAMAGPALADDNPHPRQHARVIQRTTQTIHITISQSNTNAAVATNTSNAHSVNSNVNNSFVEQVRNN